MSLRLVIEHSPWRQAAMERTHLGGELSIGRGTEADWQLEDPDQFISRKHCVITGGTDGWVVTDTSRGGLFVDGSDQPLGPGRSRALGDGTRLRLGDVVIRAEVAAGMAARPEAAAVPLGAFAADDFFAQKPVAAAPAPRPAGLPEPFDAPRARRPAAFDAPPPAREALPVFDDPFTLDPLPSRPVAEPPFEPESDAWREPTFEGPREQRAAVRGENRRRDAGEAVPEPAAPPAAPSAFDAAPTPSGPPPLPAPSPQLAGSDPFGPAAVEPPPLPGARPAPAPVVSPPVAERQVTERPAPRPAPARSAAAGASASGDLAAALLRGLGLPEGSVALGPEEAEAIGRRHRALIEGLALSLRSRAREKQNLRVAQTVLGSTDVNPLKVLPTTDEVVAALVGPPRPGYLDADAAIAGAQRDLADHQMRSWTGVQAALRRMIDRFDPEALEREAEEAGRLRAILAGGRAAFLWRLYRERFRAIAKAAEDRFLGEVGSDFRDAYESKGRGEP